MNDSRIGWIGLGNMGNPMSQQLLKAGYSLTVYNRSKGKEEPLKAAGATISESPAQVMAQSDYIFLMVSDDQAVRELFKDQNGLLTTEASGKTIINMSTVSPDISKEFADILKQSGNSYLDAPVSGSVKQANEGQLVVMVGGAEPVFNKAKPILENLGKLILHVGDAGAGNTAKLAINTLLAIQAQGLAEAIVFADKHGIKTEDLITLINAGALANAFGKIKCDAILQNNFQAAFALKHMAKDLRLAHQAGIASPLANATYDTFKQAEKVLGEEDVIAVIKQIRAQSDS